MLYDIKKGIGYLPQTDEYCVPDEPEEECD